MNRIEPSSSVGQERQQVRRLGQGRAAGHLDRGAQLVGQDGGEGGLAQTGRAVEEDVRQRLLELLAGVEDDVQPADHFFLADDFSQPPGRSVLSGGWSSRVGPESQLGESCRLPMPVACTLRAGCLRRTETNGRRRAPCRAGCAPRGVMADSQQGLIRVLDHVRVGRRRGPGAEPPRASGRTSSPFVAGWR